MNSRIASVAPRWIGGAYRGLGFMSGRSAIFSAAREAALRPDQPHQLSSVMSTGRGETAVGMDYQHRR
jgi:hypothetical protein